MIKKFAMTMKVQIFVLKGPKDRSSNVRLATAGSKRFLKKLFTLSCNQNRTNHASDWDKHAMSFKVYCHIRQRIEILVTYLFTQWAKTQNFAPY